MNRKNEEITDMEEKNDNYEFLKETIKERPLDRKKILRNAGFVAAGGILFGFLAAVTFAYVEPEIQKNVQVHKNSYVSIPEDKEPEQEKPETGDGEKLPQKEVRFVEETGDNGLSLEEYEEFRGELMNTVNEAKKSVVTVTGSRKDDEWFQDPSENQITGLIVAENEQDMFILTEYRIVKDVDRIQVSFCDDFTVDARFQKTDKNTGYTILKIPLSEIPQETRMMIKPGQLGNSYGVSQGEPVVAIGSPMGYSDSIAYGIITSVSNSVQKVDTEYGILTTDIVGGTGASGILINLRGEVIGVITQSLAREDMKNVITGLAISQTKELIEALSNNSDMQYVGIVGKTVTPKVSEQKGIPKGVFVESVEVDSPAMQAGIKNADVIVGLDGKKVESLREYQQQLKNSRCGEILKIQALRQGTEGYVEVEFELTVGVY